MAIPKWTGALGMKYRRLNGYANRGAIPGKPRLWQYPNEPALLERNTVAWMGMPTLVPSQVRGLVTCLRLALLTVALIFWLFNMKLCKRVYSCVPKYSAKLRQWRYWTVDGPTKPYCWAINARIVRDCSKSETKNPRRRWKNFFDQKYFFRDTFRSNARFYHWSTLS